MKRIISVILTLILAASVLASCASSPASSSSALSDESAAQLYTRLAGKAPENITFASGGDAEEYADLSSLRDEGYILRKSGDESFILAKTADGLDRGVRYFVNHFESSGEDYYAYGEGYRVKKLTIAGRDIAEYVIRLNDNADECHTLAATELQKYIEKTCGACLDIVTADAPHMIVFDRVMDTDPRFEALGYEGFTLEVDESGDLWIHGGEDRGCFYGVYKLLQDHIGWRFYADDHNMDETRHTAEYLYESDHVDIPAGLSDTQKPSFGLRFITRNPGNDGRFCENHYFIDKPEYNGYHITKAASHGIGPVYMEYYGTTNVGLQPCYSDEMFIEYTKDYYREKLDGRIAAGQTLGKEISYVDVAQNDAGNFCTCKNCNKLYVQDGYYTGAVLYFTNAIADFVAEEYSPKVYVTMLLYCGTTAAPTVTMPRPNVSGAFCYYTDLGNVVCYAHCADGVECKTHYPLVSYVDNDHYAKEFRRWCEICTRVTVWYYPGAWMHDFIAMPDTRNLYNDMKFFADNGVYGIYNCPSGCGSSYTATGTRPEDMFMSYALSHLAWNADMTREEYDAMVYEFLGFTCGKESAPYIADWYALRDRWARDDCWSLLYSTTIDETVDFDTVTDTFDLALSCFDSAVALAESADGEDLIEKMSLTTYFTGLAASHTEWYLLGDEAQRAHYAEIYDRFVALAERRGFSLSGEHPENRITEFPDVSVNPGTLTGGDWWNYNNGILRDCAKALAARSGS